MSNRAFEEYTAGKLHLPSTKNQTSSQGCNLVSYLVGFPDGCKVGDVVGRVGASVGETVGWVGPCVGETVGMVGASVGTLRP